MINKCAKRLKAWGKEIQRGHDAAMFEALPQMLKDKIEKELKDMEKEPQLFIVGREHSLKIGEHVYLKEPVSDRRYAAVYTTGIKAEAHRFANPSEAQRSADFANINAPKKHKFTVGLPEQFRSDITASQREAHRQHRLEESEIKKVDFMHCQKCGKDLTEGLCIHIAGDEEPTKANSIVERPAHYNQGAIDVIEALYQLLTWEQFKGFMQGNIVKYTVRFEHKDDPIIDLEKAEYYSKRLREYRNKHREEELAEKAKDWGIK